MQTLGFGPYPWIQIPSSWQLSIHPGDVIALLECLLDWTRFNTFSSSTWICTLMESMRPLTLLLMTSWYMVKVTHSMTNIWFRFSISVERGLKLNPDKCIFGESLVSFYGNVISDQGLKPDPKKVDVIVKMPVPKDKTQLTSFLGMCQYLSPYIPRLFDVTSTLWELNKKNTEFTWNATYDRAFSQAKLHVANAVTLKYFDPQAPIVIECDASGVGVGGVLLQHGQPVTFISQALTDT